eukprot:13247262-Alexandrium_andersonii.AAC.1
MTSPRPNDRHEPGAADPEDHQQLREDAPASRAIGVSPEGLQQGRLRDARVGELTGAEGHELVREGILAARMPAHECKQS